jgi:endoglucanase
MYSLQSYKASADNFMCALIPESSASHIEYTNGGLIYKPGGSNLQHATSIAFLSLVYANYLTRTSQAINCGNIYVSPTTLRQLAKRQVDYILGDNPKGISYMVGYSDYYPQRIHHRGSSMPSIKDHPQFIGCKEGSIYFNSTNPNPNILFGAVVGGPGEDDIYDDNRVDYKKSEPTTYINAPLVGVLAYLVANPTLVDTNTQIHDSSFENREKMPLVLSKAKREEACLSSLLFFSFLFLFLFSYLLDS